MCDNSILVSIRRRWGRLINPPPALSQDYSCADYNRFMKQELFRLTPSYTHNRVLVKGKDNLLSAIKKSNVMIGLLHHGSWILIGGVVRHVLKLPYTVIASRRNFAVLSEVDRIYWTRAHEYIQTYYGENFIFTDQSPFIAMSWLKRSIAVLGVAFDVREFDQAYTESKINFVGHQLWVQTGPARLAGLSKVLVVPASIHFKPECRMHELEFYDVIDPGQLNSAQALTQAVFSVLEPVYNAYKKQAFFDIIESFSLRHQPSPASG